MKRFAAILPLPLLLGCEPKPVPATKAPEAAPARLSYPVARKGDQVDDYHGVKVPDPYRWLEDPDSPETRAWVEAENKVTFGWLDQVAQRPAIRARITELVNYERFSAPFKQGGRYFWSHNDGLQPQSVLFWAESLAGTPKVLLDPNTLSKDGTVAMTGETVSDDGKLLAYGLSSGGSDWQDWHFREIDTGKDLPDKLDWVKFSGAAFTHDGKGFFYSRYPAPKEGQALEESNYHQSLWFHRMGTAQSEDQLVYERPDQKEWGFAGDVTEDGRYLIITVWKPGPKNLVFYKDLSDPKGKVVELISDWIAEFSPVGNDGSLFWLKTNLDAPKGRLIAIDLKHPDRKDWKTIVPEAAETLEGVGLVHDLFPCIYLKDAHTAVRIYDRQGKHLRDVELPGIGSAGGFGGKRTDRETFYSFTSYTAPATIYRYDMETGTSELFRKPKVAFDPTPYETEQVFVTSKDGTRVPMFIVHRKGIARDGNHPTLLDAYGGFNVSITPAYGSTVAAWLEMGGVFAQANLRGGGEYGEEWHQSGTKLRKQNVFDDFAAAAQWLIDNGWTNRKRLAITGGSNGGLLMGASLTQHPDLFAAVICQVGVLDMLRFHKFTIGWAWADDYGTSDDPEQFKALYAYSPLHNVKPGVHYPATFITTADHDDRVVPAHSFKFAATLQAAQGGDAPILIRIETKAGHGGGKPTQKAIEDLADRYSFLAKILGMEMPAAKQAAR